MPESKQTISEGQVGEVLLFRWPDAGRPVQCGHWVETDEGEGFCCLEPNHEGRCHPPAYEVVD